MSRSHRECCSQTCRSPACDGRCGQRAEGQRRRGILYRSWETRVGRWPIPDRELRTQAAPIATKPNEVQTDHSGRSGPGGATPCPAAGFALSVNLVVLGGGATWCSAGAGFAAQRRNHWQRKIPPDHICGGCRRVPKMMMSRSWWPRGCVRRFPETAGHRWVPGIKFGITTGCNRQDGVGSDGPDGRLRAC